MWPSWARHCLPPTRRSLLAVVLGFVSSPFSFVARYICLAVLSSAKGLLCFVDARMRACLKRCAAVFVFPSVFPAAPLCVRVPVCTLLFVLRLPLLLMVRTVLWCMLALTQQLWSRCCKASFCLRCTWVFMSSLVS